MDIAKSIAQIFYLSPRSLAATCFIGTYIIAGGLLAYTGLISPDTLAVVFSITLLLIASTLLNRRWLIRNQNAIQLQEAQAIQSSFSELKRMLSDQSFMLHSLSDKISADHKNREQLLMELRYLTDTLLHPELTAARVKGNPLSDHVAQRFEKHRKVVEFARNLEDSQIREVCIQELFPGIENESVHIGAINELTFHANKTDMLYVSAIAKHVGATKMFEFGTSQGRTTLHLARNNPDGQVFTLNLPPERDPRYAPYIGALFKGQEEEKRIVQIFADSKEFDTSPYRQQFDFIFVDGDHTYEMVKNDTQKAFQLLRQGGIIVWHDYAPKSDELVRFFRDFTQECPLFRIRSTCLLVYIDGVEAMKHKLKELPQSIEQKYRDQYPYLVESIYHS